MAYFDSVGETGTLSGSSSSESVVQEVNDVDVVDLLSVSSSSMSDSSLVYVGPDSRFINCQSAHMMLAEGSGIVGHVNCKYELRESLVPGAGLGVFLRDGYRLYAEEVVTQYSGQTVNERRIQTMTDAERLYCIHDEDVVVMGKTELVDGDGFGSMINASFGERRSNVTSFSENDQVFIIARLGRKVKYVTGPIELYMPYGRSWWALFHRLQQQQQV